MRLSYVASFFCFVFLISACTGLQGDLANRTYYATDYVMHQADLVTADTPILVGTITDIDNLETSSSFGRMVAEQIATRLTQTGYKVTESKMRTSLNIKDGRGNVAEGGEYMLSRDIDVLKAEQKAAIVLTGTYATAGRDILVNLKVLDVATGKILGSTDYIVPKDANISRLTSQSAGSFSGESFYGTSMGF